MYQKSIYVLFQSVLILQALLSLTLDVCQMSEISMHKDFQIVPQMPSSD